MKLTQLIIALSLGLCCAAYAHNTLPDSPEPGASDAPMAATPASLSAQPGAALATGAPSYTYLRCYYSTHDPDFPAATAYVWAKNSDGIDWFRVHGRWWADGELKWENMFYSDLSQQQLASACRSTLQQQHIDSPVVTVAAADNAAAFDHAIWTNDEPEQAPVINKVIAFGDSLSDNGNMFNASLWRLPNAWSWQHGRFSNGKIWVEYLAQSLSLPLYDWSIGGAATDTHIVVPGLLQEVDSWQTYMRSAPAYRPENTLFTMLIGANDLVNYDRSVDTVIKDQQTALQRLINSGGRNFLLLNLPDVTHAPTFQNRQDGAKVEAEVQRYNQMLATLVQDLQTRYGSTLHIQLFDAYGLFNDLLSHPDHYDVSNTTESCLQIDDESSTNYLTWHKLRPDCLNPDRNVFWDRMHPTTHTHLLLAQKIEEWLKDKNYPLKPLTN